jgi:hypothetical protein
VNPVELMLAPPGFEIEITNFIENLAFVVR